MGNAFVYKKPYIYRSHSTNLEKGLGRSCYFDLIGWLEGNFRHFAVILPYCR